MAKAKLPKNSGPFLRHKASQRIAFFVQWLTYSRFEFKMIKEGMPYRGYAHNFESSIDGKTWTDDIDTHFPYPQEFPPEEVPYVHTKGKLV